MAELNVIVGNRGVGKSILNDLAGALGYGNRNNKIVYKDNIVVVHYYTPGGIKDIYMSWLYENVGSRNFRTLYFPITLDHVSYQTLTIEFDNISDAAAFKLTFE